MTKHLQNSQYCDPIKPEKGTYVLVLRSDLVTGVQIGRWREIEIKPGYYIYIGSAFGPGGVRARVSRHLRTNKPKHWHIDYLREFVYPLELWTSYESERLEHLWATFLFNIREVVPEKGFGCSDCQCYSHLFYCPTSPDLSSFSVRFGGLSRVRLA